MGGDASHVGTTPGADEMDSDRMRLRCPRTARVATSSSLRLPFPARAPLRALRPAPEELGKPGGRLRSSLGAARARMLGLPRLDQPRPSEATLEPLRGEQGRWLARAILPSRGSPGGTRAPSPRATRAAQGCQTPTQPRRIRAQPKRKFVPRKQRVSSAPLLYPWGLEGAWHKAEPHTICRGTEEPYLGLGQVHQPHAFETTPPVWDVALHTKRSGAMLPLNLGELERIRGKLSP
ncbi:uncharacterized protein [Eschrichtius robustus]|uniref:uncharacterized protein n=1 Tax=Eschrichtius robustus TaxID=9764 RepID=UPI0035BFB797